MSASFAVAATLLALGSTAAPIDEYGYAWPIEVPRGAGAYVFELGPSVYARLSDRNLRDFAVFDASGAVPIAPAAALPRSVTTPTFAPIDERVPLPWFPLDGERGAAADDVTLRIERDAEGRLRAASTDVRAPTTAASRDATSSYVIDATALVTPAGPRPVIAFELDWREPEAAATQLPLRVLGSNDFERWQALGQGTLVDLRREGGERLVRRRIAFTAEARYRYFRFEPAGSRATLPITGITAIVSERTAVVSSRIDVPLVATPDGASADPRAPNTSVHAYRLAGPMPIERLAIELPPGASVAQLAIKSRDDADASWQLRAALTAFRVDAEGGAIVQDPAALAITRDREWRVEATPALAAAPKITASFAPEAFVVLEQGAGPYRLAAGSGTARRADYPLDAPIAALRKRNGDTWRPTRVTLGDEQVLRGDAALERPVPRATRERWLLWGVLIAGVLVLAVIVLKLLAEPRPR